LKISVKPFLLLQLRPNSKAADGEYEAYLRYGELEPSMLQRVRMTQEGIPGDLNLDAYSGVFVGGGPSNVSDSDEKKSVQQQTFEKDLSGLFDEIVERDFPYLGECYGLGFLVHHQGGVVSKSVSEPVGATTVEFTDAGSGDPLIAGLPLSFRAFVGHKEGCERAPSNAVVLAISATCPAQMIRIGKNIYATQFHPELDADGMIVRINVYKNAGYFPPEDAEQLIAKVKKEQIAVPSQILRRFIDRYSRE
jgi:GMP synthase (glutamine-hydrolysing)